MRSLEETVYIAELFSIYGGLLPTKQQEFINLHYIEDLSLSEIANQNNISRQAVHDALHQGKTNLEKYESVLKLHEKGFHTNNDSQVTVDKKLIMNILEDIKLSLRHDPIYDTDRLRAKFVKLEEVFKTTSLGAE